MTISTSLSDYQASFIETIDCATAHVNVQIYFCAGVIDNVTEDTLLLCKPTRTRLYKYDIHFLRHVFRDEISTRDHVMGSPVLWLSVRCCLICVLCRDALGESTKVPVSINASETEDARSMLDNARTDSDVTLKDDWSNLEVPQDSPLASETLSSSGKARCSRYVNYLTR